jgi:NADH-quinone oxidoreductase subunit M
VGLPGLNGFVGEIMVLISAVRNNLVLGAVAATSLILGAVYMLWMVQRVFFGEVTHEENKTLKDLNAREVGLLLPLVVMMLVMGVWTTPFTSRMTAAVDKQVVSRFDQPVAPVLKPASAAAPDAHAGHEGGHP